MTEKQRTFYFVYFSVDGYLYRFKCGQSRLASYTGYCSSRDESGIVVRKTSILRDFIRIDS